MTVQVKDAPTPRPTSEILAREFAARAAPLAAPLTAERVADLAAPMLIEAVADRIAERLAGIVAERHGQPAPLLDAAGAAAYLGVDEATIRRWARGGSLPYTRLGDGPRARLRFDPADLKEGTR